MSTLPIISAEEIERYVKLKNVTTEEDKISHSEDTDDNISSTKKGTHQETQRNDNWLGDIEKREWWLVNPVRSLVINNRLIIAFNFEGLAVIVLYLKNERISTKWMNIFENHKMAR